MLDMLSITNKYMVLFFPEPGFIGLGFKSGSGSGCSEITLSAPLEKFLFPPPWLWVLLVYKSQSSTRDHSNGSIRPEAESGTLPWERDFVRIHELVLRGKVALY